MWIITVVSVFLLSVQFIPYNTIASEKSDYWLMVRACEEITEEILSQYIKKLQDFETRYVYTDNINDCAEYIKSELDQMGYDARIQEFFYNGYYLKNIIARLNGTIGEETIVLSAHYDSINRKESLKEPYAYAPGADDDASGVAAVLASAKVLKQFSFEKNIEFVLFTGEEIGRIGSKHYVKNIKDEEYMDIQFDMIGYNWRYSKVDIVVNNDSIEMAEAGEYVNKLCGLEMIVRKVITTEDSYRWSDHVSFWEVGKKAICLIEDENPQNSGKYYEKNTYYETEEDTIEKLNMSLVRKITCIGMCIAMHLAVFNLLDATVKNAKIYGEMTHGNNGTLEFVISHNFHFKSIVRVFLDDLSIYEDEIKNGTYIINFRYTAGHHEIIIYADANDEVAEVNESNNYMIIKFYVKVKELDIWWVDVPRRISHSGLNSFTLGIYSSWKTNISIEILFDNIKNTTTIVMIGVKFLNFTSNFSHGKHSIIARASAHNLMKEINYTFECIKKEEILLIYNKSVMSGDVVTFRCVGNFSFCMFDFGDGNSTDWSKEFVVEHVYRRYGNYTVRVFACTDFYYVSMSAKIQVENRHPRANFMHTRAFVNDDVKFSASKSIDVDGRIVHIWWRFGDGEEVNGSWKDYSYVSHKYKKEGSYIVTLRILDDYGYYDEEIKKISVEKRKRINDYINIWVSDIPIIENKKVTMGIMTSIPRDKIKRCLWEFGDENKSEGMEVTHVYHIEGSFQVNVSIEDHNGKTYNASLEIEVISEKNDDVMDVKKNDVVERSMYIQILLMIAVILLLLIFIKKHGLLRL